MIQDDSTLKWYLYGDVSERETETETETEKERQRETEREKKLILQGIRFPKITMIVAPIVFLG